MQVTHLLTSDGCNRQERCSSRWARGAAARRAPERHRGSAVWLCVSLRGAARMVMMRVGGGSFLRTSPRVDAAQTPGCRSMFWSRPRRVRARGHEHDRASARYTLGRYLAGPHATAVPGGPPTRRRRVRERRRGRVAALVYSLVSRRFVRMKSRGIHQRHMNGARATSAGIIGGSHRADDGVLLDAGLPRHRADAVSQGNVLALCSK